MKVQLDTFDISDEAALGWSLQRGHGLVRASRKDIKASLTDIIQNHLDSWAKPLSDLTQGDFDTDN